ncbi:MULTISPECIES: hemolysin family protein [unclassified Dysgonomonas]|uniref:hemolysin family protein n=1 Tax=unclassified Dysgonomonas TaxID=2630389 RepID=UPI00067FCB1F|nr:MULTISPECIES: hemolysin family protein [unclassified Dysgonomonas]MBD8346431.1 HlyC/CorC family transporter [Dysgonomonas sp. HGC4]MBF0574654.1 HlyC/CorC family transporter [Dysgonomonas sp. GY617]
MDILIIVVLILINGLFSMSEIAIISARKSKLNSDAKLGNPKAAAALKLANEPDKFLSTVQIGITLVGIVTGIYSGDVLAKDMVMLLNKWGISGPYIPHISQIFIVLFVTYLTLIFGELVPKRIGLSISERIAQAVARPMYLLSVAATPFVWLLSKSTSLVVRAMNLNVRGNKVTEEEIRSIIQEGTKDGVVDKVEQDIVERVFSLGDRDLESIMTHHSDIVWIDTKMSTAEIYKFLQEKPFDVYPVAHKDLDNIIGVVYLKDLFGKIEKEDFNIESVTRPCHYFPENIGVYTALEQMKTNHVQYALICDEFGSIQGIVTLTDILEALVGNIPDIHEEPDIVERKDGGWLVDGQCPFYNFLTFFEKEYLYTQNDYNTISGLILDLLQHIPQTGEIIEWNDFTFEIVDMDGARIDKVLVSLNSAEEF